MMRLLLRRPPALPLFGLSVLLTAFAAPAHAQSDADSPGLEFSVTVGMAPLPGTGIDPDKVPSNVQSVSAGKLDTRPADLGDNLASRLPSVSINDEQGSPAQPDIEYRGFDASPIFGEAQGLAVYENGTRMNEAFGDTVNWDLIPQFAVNTLTLQSGNPVFGLNAIGGAVTLDMKNGFNYVGNEFDVSGGSFGRRTATFQTGRQFGNFATYLGVSGYYDDGFRDHSSDRITQAYGDIGEETDRLKLHLSFSGASNDIRAVGPSPIDLLNVSRSAVFTYPQGMQNNDAMVQLNGSYQATGTLNLSGNVYYRHFFQSLIDGNTTDATPCDPGGPEAGFMCLGGDGSGGAADLLYSSAGQPVPDTFTAGGLTPGEIDRTKTSTDTVGGTLQASDTHQLFRHDNTVTGGLSIDHGTTDYTTSAELSIQQPGFAETGTGTFIDQALNPAGATELLNPVSLNSTNDYYGLYLTDSFDVTSRLTLTLSGRYNIALIDLNDRLGTSLNGNHRYSRFNPGAGLTYKITDTVTGYLSYSEANRAPTPGELACADPSAPCVLDAFLESDPNLKQVVARSWELGLRGHFRAAPFLPGHFTWNAGLFRTDSQDDIIQVATPTAGFGFFQNAGTTRREGLETSLGYKDKTWSINAGYSYVDATYRNALTLSSDSPAADTNGLIQVLPGDHLPLIPQHRFTISGDWDATPKWSLGADLRFQSGAFLAGDNSNQEALMPGYYTLDLRTSYQLTKTIQVYAEVDNVTAQKYETFGTFADFGDTSGEDSFSPGAPQAYYVGVKADF
jgi:iron complex outermembrane receptor protein